MPYLSSQYLLSRREPIIWHHGTKREQIDAWWWTSLIRRYTSTGTRRYARCCCRLRTQQAVVSLKSTVVQVIASPALRFWISLIWPATAAADIVRDFQSKLLQDEWNKFGTTIVHRRNERLQRLQAAVNENQQKRSAYTAMQQPRLAALDAQMDQLSATIADQTTAMDYDASQLVQKYRKWIDFKNNNEMDAIEKDSKPLPCLGQRAHWIDCQKKYAADSRPCNFYVTALEECVTRTIFGGEDSSSSVDTGLVAPVKA
jgi:hypothetical protein